MRPLVVIPCGGDKLDRRARADRLYVGSFHKLAMRAARALTVEERIRIVSGRHGLLRLDTWVDPYDQRADSIFAISREEVRAQAEDQGLVGERPVLLLPIVYALLVEPAWPESVNPLAGAAGIGIMRQRLAAIVAGEETACLLSPDVRQ